MRAWPPRPLVRSATGTIGRAERTAVLAWSMALAALAVDFMLPAFGEMREYFDLPADSNKVASLLTAYFVGMALGQLAYGPISDRFGRKPTLFVGFGIYALGALICVTAPSLSVLVAGRFVWGIGAAGARVVTQAVVRDSYEGDEMARAMSLILAVFLLVPVVSPAIGTVIVDLASWRWSFGVCLIAVVLTTLWATRLPETLDPRHRLELSPRRVGGAARTIVSNRMTLAYVTANTLLFGGFTSWVGSSEVIITETFDQNSFALVFGAIGAVMGTSMLVNSRIVSRFSARRVMHSMFFVYLGNATAFVVTSISTGGRPPFVLFVVHIALIAVSQCLMIPNSTSIAMLPMAAFAGTAASVAGATQIAGGAILAAITDRAYDGTVRPLAFGFLIYGSLAFLAVLWGERWHLFGREPGAPDTRDAEMLGIEV